MGIMPGCGSKQWKYRQVVRGGRGSEHVKVITKVIALPVGVIANVTVRLVVNAITFAVADALFQTVTGTCLAFSGTGIDRGTIAGDSEAVQVDKPLADRSIQELRFKDLEQASSRSEVFGRLDFKFLQKIIDSDFFDGRSLFPFFVRFFWFLLRRVYRVRDIVRVREPEPVKKVVKEASREEDAFG